MYSIKRQVLKWSVFFMASALLMGCAGKIKDLSVRKTLPGQQKVVKARIVKNYDTVQSRSVIYQLNGSQEQSASDQAINAVGSNNRTYSFEVPGSGALQPGQALDFTWTITFNRGGAQSKQKSFVVPGVPDLYIPVGAAFEFRVNNQLLPGTPGSFNPDLHPEVQVNQAFTALVRVGNSNDTLMNEPFVVRVNVFNLQTSSFEELETTIPGIPQGQEVFAAVTYQSDSPTTLIFTANVDVDNEIPEITEANNDTLNAQYRIRVVN